MGNTFENLTGPLNCNKKLYVIIPMLEDHVGQYLLLKGNKVIEVNICVTLTYILCYFYA